jgi:hypothetical protein
MEKANLVQRIWNYLEKAEKVFMVFHELDAVYFMVNTADDFTASIVVEQDRVEMYLKHEEVILKTYKQVNERLKEL